MRNKYLNRKKLRNQNREEGSAIEKRRQNVNNSQLLENDKSEEKNPIPAKSKSEQSSSTLSARSKDERLNTFSFTGKKDRRKDKRLIIQQNKEEEIKTHIMDDFNKKFLFFQKQLDELKDQRKAHGLKIDNLEKEKQTQELKIDNLEKEVRRLDDQVKELDKYYFAGKLRKLSKKLIEYITKNYYYS